MKKDYKIIIYNTHELMKIKAKEKSNIPGITSMNHQYDSN